MLEQASIGLPPASSDSTSSNKLRSEVDRALTCVGRADRHRLSNPHNMGSAPKGYHDRLQATRDSANRDVEQTLVNNGIFYEEMEIDDDFEDGTVPQLATDEEIEEGREAYEQAVARRAVSVEHHGGEANYVRDMEERRIAAQRTPWERNRGGGRGRGCR
jgi:hypothetical protein